MVDPITRISGSDGTSPTSMSHSLSISAEPDNAWVAARQSQINRDLEALGEINRRQDQSEQEPADEPVEEREPHPEDRRTVEAIERPEAEEAAPEAELLSGESERIGCVNFDEDTPFGHRTAIV